MKRNEWHILNIAAKSKKEQAAGGLILADTMYIKIGQKIRVTQPSVSIGELGDLWCANASIQAHCKALHYTNVYGQRAVGDILKVTQLIQKEYPAVQVENLGETDFIIEYVQERKKRPVWEYTKVVLVCMMISLVQHFLL